MLIESTTAPHWAVKKAAAGLLVAAVAAGCSTPPHRAPVEDRTPTRAPITAVPVPSSSDLDALKPLPGAEDGSRPGYYTVKPGDTLIRIGLDNGQSWKDLIRWNNIENPNVIEVGQVLRVLPPGVDATAASTRPVTTARLDPRPLDAKPSIGAASGASSPAVLGTAAALPAAAPAPPTPPSRDGDDAVNWAWPAAGPVVAPFDDGKVKGLAIGGKAGDPVLAAADGRVMYAGSGLRGYGNLIILKHNNTYLTAYAHNQTLLVKEDQTVKRGQKIAEMGATDTDAVKLHFEIRKLGKPIDPARLLPPR